MMYAQRLRKAASRTSIESISIIQVFDLIAGGLSSREIWKRNLLNLLLWGYKDEDIVKWSDEWNRIMDRMPRDSRILDYW